MLKIAASDNPAAQLIYTIEAAPLNGTLKKNSAALGAGGSFTQADVDGGTISYTHNDSETTSDSFRFTVTDGAGGTLGSTTFAITITPVNDPPRFNKEANQTILEDAGPQTFPGWASAITNEAGQTLSFQITNNTNPGLFAGGPAVDANGTLSFLPAPNASGNVTLTLVLKDNSGGQNSSPTQAFGITIMPVNDAPAFAKGPDLQVDSDAGPQTIAGWATAISAGAPNELGQRLDFVTTGNTNPGLFAVQPTVDPAGGGGFRQRDGHAGAAG